MNVVGHQTVSVQGHAVSLSVFRKPFQVGLVIPLGEESLLPLISANNHMIEETGSKDPRPPCHDDQLSSKWQDCQD